MKRVIQIVCVAAVFAALGSSASAVDIETVPVGNRGNAADTEVMNDGTTGYGRVDYDYNIGKYEVSNAEYCEFLNAVATVDDPHGLYNSNMGGGWNDIGGISRSGSGALGDPWVYSTRENRGNRPVNYVSWYDALRFTNWLHNGQPTGAQDLTTTEDGAYFLNGVTNPPSTSITRELDWKWAVASEDEWYKAAYHNGATGVYYDYPTGSDTAPKSEAPAGTDMTNGSANYWDGEYVDPTYHTTECGAYDAKPSESAYGTFDQGGNVWEWNIARVGGHCIRGGSFNYEDSLMSASYHHGVGNPANETYDVGFRVSEVPEPATLLLLALGGAGLFRRQRNVRG